MGRILALGAALFFGLASQAAARCWVPSFRFCDGCSTDVNIEVGSGEVCRIRYHARGGVKHQRVFERPRHGVYGSENLTSGAYKATAGYTGPDDFKVGIVWDRKSGGETHTVLRVHVTVK